MDCDVLIVGGGTGGCASALAASAMGLRVVMTEETAWIGGQLTSQAVPPDEHPWIESFGCTARYRRFRHLVRKFYKRERPLTRAAQDDPRLNPGGGWVSRLCHEPGIAWTVLNRMLQDGISGGQLFVRLECVPVGVHVSGDRVDGVVLRHKGSKEEFEVRAAFVVDATESGDLLPMAGAEYSVGAESKQETGEPHAEDGPAQPGNQQGLTWVFAMGYRPGADHTISKPTEYERWSAFQPRFWPGRLLGPRDLDPVTGQPRQIPVMSEDWKCWFRYRQVVDPLIYHDEPKPYPVTLVNWPMNDYFLKPVIDVSPQEREERLEDARQLSLSLLYHLQTEHGLTELCLCPEVTGTATGLAMAPYLRESRRIKARLTLREQDVSADCNPNCDRAPEVENSVGVGCYRIDLHPSTGGDSYIDLGSLPYQIPLGCLVPVRVVNLLPGCKNIGVTHITNGCTRLHPVEWNIGEAAGLLAAFCLQNDLNPGEVLDNKKHSHRFQTLLVEQGIELSWPKLHEV